MVIRRKVMKEIAQFAKRTDQKLVVKEGANHTRVWVGERYATVARHNEINELMAQKIYKQIGML